MGEGLLRASERSERSEHIVVVSTRFYYIYIIGERAKRARHSLVCSIENRGYIYYILLYIIYSTCNFVLITRKEGGA